MAIVIFVHVLTHKVVLRDNYITMVITVMISSVYINKREGDMYLQEFYTHIKNLRLWLDHHPTLTSFLVTNDFIP